MMKILKRRTKAKAQDGHKEEGRNVLGQKVQRMDNFRGKKKTERRKETGKKRDKSDGKKAEIGFRVCYAGV
jgi:hypothetical protein